MNPIIQSSLHTLNKSKDLLFQLTDDTLSNTCIAPYHSTIGSHIRHILDFYDCIFSINDEGVIDLTARSRNKMVETNCYSALCYLETIIAKLTSFQENLDEQVIVRDDLGLGIIDMPYSLAAIFSQANSHTIHHYAIINYILEGLKISCNTGDFGYNPTTPKRQTIN